ncbi:hypothetical protein LAZ67_16002319 [Cordylochernes scorpioides]|uniref:Uncharacterized protein n=1 Tax=Cordylochernes scorpioides TaxID=51811 RepID=A0ABY6LEH7_9ARAC|nr:hypothetical protein LAZ67_16002319 [Cordylochernes scorpioides]
MAQEYEETRSQATMIGQTQLNCNHSSSSPQSLLRQPLNRDPEEVFNYDGDGAATHFFQH